MNVPLPLHLLEDREPDARQLRQALQDLGGRYRTLFEHATDLIWTLSDQGVLTSINPAFATLTGWSRDEWLNKAFLPLLHPADVPLVGQTLSQTLQGAISAARDVRIRVHNGAYLIANYRLFPLTELGQIAGAIGLARDVTELRQLQSVEREQARTDQLTGLVNRRGCEEAFVRETARATRENGSVGVVLFDIDHFKKVNDTYGHEAGDAILKGVAGALRGVARASDVPGRWGGEELLAILPGVDVAGARRFAERVRVAVAALEGLPCPVTVSAGTAEWTKGQDVKAVLARADRMLYDAKGAGRNRVH
jgi:diguanylate cyclase (GGDEF)-like protein/PAS domain S-box-containing protein